MEFDVLSPKTTKDLLTAISENQNANFRLGAGYTDLLPELKENLPEDLIVINISQLSDRRFKDIVEEGDFIRVGANVNAQQLIDNELIRLNYPGLTASANSVASIQIRNVATIGGNICTASPSGDMSCALIALQSICEIINTEGKVREEKLCEFINGVRKTTLVKNEVLRSLKIPKNQFNKLHSGFVKVGSRNSMEISIVSLAYHLQLNKIGTIEKAGISIGAVAPNIPFVAKAADYLIGKNLAQLSEEERKGFATQVLEYASPISDIRASDWYRKEVLFNISKEI
jgi:CO/xanthine dehydrogenase FAD-binding subunit